MSRFGNDIQLAYAGNAYDFAVLTGELFGKVKQKPTAQQILSAFEGVKPGTGVSGPYHFEDTPDGGRHFKFDIVVRKIEGINTTEVYRSNYGSQLQ